jgi:pimeloyl-ACP methyl ester carboxylesterase
MNGPTNPMFTPARIVALALIALLAAGLAYLRFAPGGAGVSVPDGAHAGQLTLHDCSYGTEDGSYDADCGTLVVPENRADPKSRLIGLPVTRIRARSAHPAEPVFRLEGGPGRTNMQFTMASRFAGSRDVVLVGYRGVDGSSVLDCPEVESAVSHSNDIGAEKSMRAYGSAFRACADRLQGDGVDLAGYGLAQQVDDLEAARKALGYERIDLVSESAGTRTALIYSWRHAESIHRSVMIGANPPGHFVWDAKTTDEQIQRYSALCAKDEACSKRTDDLGASMRRVAADIPDRFLFLPIKPGNVRTASFYGLAETTSEAAPLSGPMTLGSWLSADHGDASGLWFQSLLAGLAFPKAFVWGQMAAAAMVDADAAREHFATGRQRDSILGDPSAFIWAGGRLADVWPADADKGAYSRMRTSNTETLVIGGELDFATPPQVATKELLPYLPKGHQVVLPGFGHSTSVWTQQPEAGSRLINTFLASGKVDRSLYEPQKVDFTPEVTQTALGKGLAGAMVGLALLTVLSLLAMARRVHRRGRFGRKSSALLRSLYPIVLGLGGWFLGLLIVITTMPGVPLDDELLALLSVGVPVGLGVYLAWVHRDSSAQSRSVGLAAAAAGALAGAWLGFHATTDLLALGTAIVGAVAGANLALVILDMSRGGSAGDRPATRTTVETRRPNLEPATPTGTGTR